MVGKQKLRAKAYVIVSTIKEFGKLIKDQVQWLKEEEINLKVKYTILKYTTKVGILLGSNIE